MIYQGPTPSSKRRIRLFFYNKKKKKKKKKKHVLRSKGTLRHMNEKANTLSFSVFLIFCFLLLTVSKKEKFWIRKITKSKEKTHCQLPSLAELFGVVFYGFISIWPVLVVLFVCGGVGQTWSLLAKIVPLQGICFSHLLFSLFVRLGEHAVVVWGAMMSARLSFALMVSILTDGQNPFEVPDKSNNKKPDDLL